MIFDNTASILCVGDIILDQYTYGLSNRISPEAPVAVVKHATSQFRLGGAANVANNISTYGLNVTLLSVYGSDSPGIQINLLLDSSNISNQSITSQHIPTIVKHRIISNGQQLLRVDHEAESPYPTDLFRDKFNEIIDQFDYVCFSDYGKGVLSDIQDLISICRDKSIFCIVDPKGSNFDKYRGASLLTPNESEFIQIMGKPTSEDHFHQLGFKLLTDLELEALLVTLGPKGMCLFRAEHPLHFSATAKEVFDVTGVYDTVVATVSSALASNYSFNDAVSMANSAAGIAVSKVGTSTVLPTELLSSSTLPLLVPRILITMTYFFSFPLFVLKI